jgi:hypothetical protein
VSSEEYQRRLRVLCDMQSFFSLGGCFNGRRSIELRVGDFFWFGPTPSNHNDGWFERHTKEKI